MSDIEVLSKCIKNNSTNILGYQTNKGKNEDIILDLIEYKENIIINRKPPEECLPYFPDGYCKETNTIYEVYEKVHYSNDEIIKRDKERQEYIQNKLGCKFVVIKDPSKEII